MAASAVIVAGVLGKVGLVLAVIVGLVVVGLIAYLVYGSLPGTAKRRNAKYQAARDKGKSAACAAGQHGQCTGCDCSCHPKPKLSLECATLGRHERCKGELPNTHERCECQCHRPAASSAAGSPLPPPAG